MVSKKVRPTAPPRSPALVRPAVGALLIALGGACGDDGTGEDSSSTSTGNDEGCVSGTCDDTLTAPMPDPSATDTEVGTTVLPPMPDPSDTDGSTTAGDGTAEVTGKPPMPDPTETAGSSGSGTTGM